MSEVRKLVRAGLLRRVAMSLGRDPLVEFHRCGEHDCQSHGNWAKGGKQGDPGLAGLSDERDSDGAPVWLTPKQKKLWGTATNKEAYEGSIRKALERRAAAEAGEAPPTPAPRNRYTGPKPVIFSPGQGNGYVSKLSDRDIQLIKNPKDPKAEYAGMALYDPVRGQWITPEPHPFYRMQLSGLGPTLMKVNPDGRTVLDTMIEDQEYIKVTGGGINERTGRPSNPTYWYDGARVGLPAGTRIKIAIDEGRRKIPSLYPEGQSLPARYKFQENGIQSGNEIVNLNTAEGRRRYSQLVNRETHGPAFGVLVAAGERVPVARIISIEVEFENV